MATKRVKFIKAWQMTPVGAEMELDTPVADLLISRGRAEEIMDDEILIEVKLDDREIARQIDKIGRKLKSSLDIVLGTGSTADTDRTTRVIRDKEVQTLVPKRARRLKKSQRIKGK